MRSAHALLLALKMENGDREPRAVGDFCNLKEAEKWILLKAFRKAFILAQ